MEMNDTKSHDRQGVQEKWLAFWSWLHLIPASLTGLDMLHVGVGAVAESLSVRPVSSLQSRTRAHHSGRWLVSSAIAG